MGRAILHRLFGDASQNATQGKLLDANWRDRIEVIKAMLDAVPADRMVQLRYPQIKQRYIYGINALITSAPLTDAQAFSENDIARLGYHNDCFWPVQTILALMKIMVTAQPLVHLMGPCLTL